MSQHGQREGDDGAFDSDEESGEHQRARRSSRITARPASRLQFEAEAFERANAAKEGRLEPPSSGEMLAAVLELNRTVDVEMTAGTIIDDYVLAMRGLFPRRRFAVRLLEEEAGVCQIYATERLDPARQDRVELSADGQHRHGLEDEALSRVSATSAELYVPIFAQPGSGFDVPLRHGEQLIGVMNVEYAPGLEEPSFDRSLIVPLAVQLGSALRNARLLRESDSLRRNMEKLLDNANAPIVVLGRERELRVVNRAMLAVTGADRAQILGRDFLELLPQAERARIAGAFQSALRGESSHNLEVRLKRPNGERGTGDGTTRLLVNTASILSGEGEVEGVIAIGRDLTEVRELEEQVIQAEKLATLGQLAAGVVHELNNPLTSISVYGEYLLRKGERAETEPADLEKLRRIVESADRILKFTRDLVTYARPSSEEPTYVRVQPILNQSLLFCDHVVSDVSAVVRTRFEDGDASVYAVKGQLHQVFINLITNACHAMPTESGELEIRSFVEDEHVHIEVADNGHGISDDHRARIFDPFFSTKGEGKGTGLGLSIVRNIVRQHGGDIEVRRGDNGGTVFAVRLPGRTI
ncbi:MAG: ATP-binding protein [Sandaracinaceae bacterium]